MAASRPIDPDAIDHAHDYSQESANDDFWLDFIADTGDGWNSTYAMARLLADPQLTVGGVNEPLLRGRILVMGGDQIYPTASRDSYQERLEAPFREAAAGKIDPAHPPHVYAVPGNHDWYDGLLAFLGLFCRRRNSDNWASARPGRNVGGRATQQVRSYFAIELPHEWWLWGADVQLSGYIDQPQIDYFSHIAREWMKPGSRLILCTGQPSWAYVDPQDPEPKFRNFSYLESLAGLAGKGHRLCLILTGDSHHYCRFVEGDCNYITAGGGGAFLHPTHQLTDRIFAWPYPHPGVPGVAGQTYTRKFSLARDQVNKKPATFPDQAVSKTLTLRNFFFAALNWQYTATVAGFYAFFIWLLNAQAAYLGTSLQASLVPQPLPSFAVTAQNYMALGLISPWPTLLLLLSIAGYFYLADFPSYWRLVVGALHGAIHAILVMIATCILARWFSAIPAGCFIIATGLAAGVLSATTLGIYFLLSLTLFGRHWDEAFAALRIQDYKCFLRLRFGPAGRLMIYPIGLKQVPREPRSGTLRNPPLKPHLIEGPIEIN
ncbi:hypothetical protein G5V57_18240 [Nordella sp. HKS 07]|uniref:metallophosphoesterase n=1 Tax=Nordella sp. HKS 07 TaxID=2712222 RepID=UPI0013E1A528|nr:metallophosphoesterase [Nordella sp. HKS 07]QIG49480.1 hypothetical protein G5V57_18240 [Nordella sp. HKS 07]